MTLELAVTGMASHFPMHSPGSSDLDDFMPESVGEAVEKVWQELASGQGRLSAQGSKLAFVF